MRLDKFLAEMGVGSRSQVKEYIKKGLVEVNGEKAKKPEIKVNPEADTVSYNGEDIHFTEYEYYMLNKPAGYVSATKDNVSETVVSLIKDSIRDDLFPVGRLDKDTEGLLLITNDGELSHNLLSPKKHIEKTYFAKIDGMVTKEDADIFSKGMDIGDEKPTLPAVLKIIKSDRISEIELTISEGRFHQVKRMFQAVDKKVIYLKRLSMGNLKLDDSLSLGEYRKLTNEELEILRSNNVK